MCADPIRARRPCVCVYAIHAKLSCFNTSVCACVSVHPIRAKRARVPMCVPAVGVREAAVNKHLIQASARGILKVSSMSRLTDAGR